VQGAICIPCRVRSGTATRTTVAFHGCKADARASSNALTATGKKAHPASTRDGWPGLLAAGNRTIGAGAQAASYVCAAPADKVLFV